MTEPATAPPVPHYQVQSTAERTIIGPANTALDVTTVYYVLDNGATGSVDIPRATFTPANVKAALDAAATNLYAVHQIGQ